MNNSLEDVYSHDILYIEEQNLTLSLDIGYPVYDSKDDIKVIIGHELNFCKGQNMGDLMTGIVKLEQKEENGLRKTILKVILPFNKRLLYARFLNNDNISLAYVEDKRLKHKIIKLQEDKTLLYDDYAFLLEEEKIIPFQNNAKRILMPHL